MQQSKTMGKEQTIQQSKTMGKEESKTMGKEETIQQSKTMEKEETGQQSRKIGKYEMIEELGRGGMGCVYKVHDSQLRRVVALKLMLAGERAKQEDVDRFFREAQSTAQLKHPNIIAVYDMGMEGNQPFFTMDFIEGHSLKDMVKKSSLTIKEIVQYMIKIGKGIQYAHENGIIHRDLKPANIMIDKENEPKIMDFGLAKVAKASKKLSKTGMIAGTLQYMPPEQAEGLTAGIDARSDVYALGAILYELLTGRPPFVGGTSFHLIYQILKDDPIPPASIKARVPKDLESICMKALEKEKGARYQSAKEFVEDLTRFLNDEPVLARPVGLSRVIVRKIKRYRVLVSACILTALCTLAILYFWMIPRKDPFHLTILAPSELSHKNVMVVSPDQGEINFKLKISHDIPAIQIYWNGELQTWYATRGEVLKQMYVDYGKTQLEFLLWERDRWKKERTISLHRPPYKTIQPYRADDRRTGVFPSHEILKKPKIQWSLELTGFTVSPPVISEGVAYCTSSDGTLYAIHVKTGKKKWQQKIGHNADGPPLVVENFVLAGSYDGKLYAFDRDGKFRWSFLTEDIVVASAAYNDGMVYFLSDTGSLYALHLQTGAKKWQYSIPNPTRGKWNYSAPTVVQGSIYCGMTDESFCAFDAKEGKLLWQKKASGKFTSPVFVDNVIYFGSSNGCVYALNANDGRPIWQYPTFLECYTSPAIVDGTLYFGTFKEGTKGHKLNALDTQTGKIKWSYSVSDPVFGGPIIIGNTVYFASGPILYALDKNTKALRWQLEFPLSLNEASAWDKWICVTGCVRNGIGNGYIYGVCED